MKFLSHLKDWLALTKNEKKVLLFLVSFLVIGMGLNYFKNQFSPDLPYFTNEIYDSLFTEKAKDFEKLSDKNNSGKVTEDLKININTANKTELMELPGVGEEIADRIMIYRNDNGLFKMKKDLRKVKGIGEKKFKKISPHVVLK